jgi:predicted nucleic acid-binding protein
MTYIKKVIEKSFKIKRNHSLYVADSALMAARNGNKVEIQ